VCVAVAGILTLGLGCVLWLQELQRQKVEKKQLQAEKEKTNKQTKDLLVNRGGKARPKMSFGLSMKKPSK